MSLAPLTLAAALSEAAHLLSQAGIGSAHREAEWLLQSILKIPRSDLYARPDLPLPSAHAALIRDAVDRRCARVPLQHILGETEFYGLPFRVAPGALIPRPETETLVEVAADCLARASRPYVLDVGTGTGIIAICVAVLLPAARCVATDMSPDALRLARDNARLNGVSVRVRLLRADLLSAFLGRPAFDAVLSNPPYIPSDGIDSLQPEVARHDPRMALDGGPDGCRYYRALAPEAGRLIKPGGLLGLEIGDGQGAAVADTVRGTGSYSAVRVLPDLAGRERVVLADRLSD